MFPVLIAFLEPALWSVTNIMDAKISNHIFKKIPTIIFYNILTNIIVLPIIFLLGVPHLPGLSVLPYLFLFCLLDILYLFPYYLAVRRADTSINVAYFSLGEIATPLLAFFIISEKPTVYQCVGFFIIIICNIILSLEKGKKFKINTAFWLMLLVSLINIFQTVLLKIVLERLDWLSTALWGAVIPIFIGLPFLVFPQVRRDILSQMPVFKKNWKIFIGNEIISQAAGIVSKFALSFLPVIVYRAIAATQTLFVLGYSGVLRFFGYRYMKEKLDYKNVVKKLICFIFIIFGLILTLFEQ
ncbi:MAG: hypothetical protein LBU87_06835 [Lactobacillales bacterium]|jgi:drug/metabolite transporter (DMT)-like permease|nr:hypothetical protein [Lactobacillales bacterium]